MNLLYITFGKNHTIHTQAAFSIYSFLQYANLVESVNVMTDAPELYNHLKEKVNLIVITEEKIKEWQGPFEFFWRVKIKALEHLSQLYPGKPLLYSDSDTWLYKPLAPLAAELKKGKAIMHVKEWRLQEAPGKTGRRMWTQIKNKRFGGLIMEDVAMWNAGIVASPNTLGAQEFQLALNICDDMCAAGVTRRLIEQLALSIALDHSYGLQDTEEYIIHYWSTKHEWNAKMNEFLLHLFFQNILPADLGRYIHQFDYSKLPIHKRESNTARKLHRLIDATFKVKDIQYPKKDINRKG